MQQTNSAFDGDIDRVSVAESLAERSAISTPGRSNKGRNERKYSNHSTKEQQKRDEEPKQTSSSDEDSYYSLQRFRERRRGERDDDSSLSRSVKRFYKRQDELIDVYERIHNQNSEHGEALIQAEEEKRKRVQKISNILTKVSLGVNIVSNAVRLIALVAIVIVLSPSSLVSIYFKNRWCSIVQIFISNFISDRFGR